MVGRVVRDTLTIHVDTAHPMGLYAAVELARGWQRVTGAGVALDVPWRASAGPRVRLSLGSVVRPSVVVTFERSYEEKAARAADVLGLTLAAWDALGEREVWRELAAPLDRFPHVGAPSPSAPWAVTLPTRDRRPSADSQLHILGGLRPPTSGAVWWPPMSRVAAAVLGRAAVVMGRDNPLVYDAIRAGVPTEHAEVPLGTLAGLVPPSLVGADALWDHVADTAREVHRTGDAPEPLMTPGWVARGRDRVRDHRAAPPTSVELLRRRYHKLQRDPQRFFADSRHAVLRAIGRAAFPNADVWATR